MPAYAYTQKIDKSHKEIMAGKISIDLDGYSIDEAVKILREYEQTLPNDHTRNVIDIDHDYEYGECYIRSEIQYYRLETDNERDGRVAQVEAYNAEVLKRKQAQLEALKKELGE